MHVSRFILMMMLSSQMELGVAVAEKYKYQVQQDCKVLKITSKCYLYKYLWF